MKILMITPWYPDKLSPNSGIFIRSQAEALSSEHEVVVISVKVNYSKFGLYSFQKETSWHGKVEEHRIVIHRSLPLYNQLNYWFIMMRYSRKVLQKFKPDIIHASIGYPGAFWGWLLKKVTGRAYILQEHTRVKNNFRSLFHKKLTLYGLRHADAIVAVGRHLANELETLLDKNVHVIPNVVEIEKFKEIFPAQDSTIQIGFLGGMNTPVKGLDILLTALAGISEDFILHIGGTGTLEDEYKKQARQMGIESKCRFYGFIPYEEIPLFMSRLHFFICSSRYETFCVALVEAMAAGLPVVSTRCGGPEDFVNDTNGLLVTSESADALREGIQKLMQTRQMYNSQAIRKYAQENFSKQSFLARIDTVYQSLIR
jgi:L-malate glycosyltransferase